MLADASIWKPLKTKNLTPFLPARLSRFSGPACIRGPQPLMHWFSHIADHALSGHKLPHSETIRL